MSRIWKRLLSSLAKFTVLVSTGLVIMHFDSTIAQALDIPALAPILLSAGWLCVAAAISHVARVILFPSLDLMQIGHRAINEANLAAALVFLGICFVLGMLLISQARGQTLSERAAQHLPVLVAEQRQHWAAAPEPWTMAGQVEAESAWKPNAELRTHREWGAGLAQLTKVWDSQGVTQFDRLADARSLHPSLRGWTWDDRFAVDKQLRALVLMDLAEWRYIVRASSVEDHWAFVLAAYNGGRGGLVRDRSLCSGVRGCQSDRWFGHVEHHSWRSKTAVKGYSRSFFHINREYVRSIMKERRHKYAKAWM